MKNTRVCSESDIQTKMAPLNDNNLAIEGVKTLCSDFPSTSCITSGVSSLFGQAAQGAQAGGNSALSSISTFAKNLGGLLQPQDLNAKAKESGQSLQHTLSGQAQGIQNFFNQLGQQIQPAGAGGAAGEGAAQAPGSSEGGGFSLKKIFNSISQNIQPIGQAIQRQTSGGGGAGGNSGLPGTGQPVDLLKSLKDIISPNPSPSSRPASPQVQPSGPAPSGPAPYPANSPYPSGPSGPTPPNSPASSAQGSRELPIIPESVLAEIIPNSQSSPQTFSAKSAPMQESSLSSVAVEERITSQIASTRPDGTLVKQASVEAPPEAPQEVPAPAPAPSPFGPF